MTLSKRLVLPVGLVAALLIAAAGATWAVAAANNGPEQINTCVNPAGQPRIVDSVDECKRSETPVVWNQAGPPGPSGPPGPPGPAATGVNLQVELSKLICAGYSLQCVQTGHNHFDEPAAPGNHNLIEMVVRVLDGSTPVYGLTRADFRVGFPIKVATAPGIVPAECDTCFLSGEGNGLYVLFFDPFMSDDPDVPPFTWKVGTYYADVVVTVPMPDGIDVGYELVQFEMQ